MPTLSTRISAIQTAIGVPVTGVIDIVTCQELLQRGQRPSASTSLVTLIKMVQRMVNADDDGIVGPQTVTRIESFIDPRLPRIPPGASLVVSKKSPELIIFFEVTSKQVYDARYQSPQWPGGASGVTIGIGYDLGYYTPQQFTNEWSPHVSAASLQTLLPVCQHTGAAARALLAGVQSVKITFDAAAKVFYQSTLPDFARRTRRTFPGIEKLPPDAQGGLLSLVYNRGTSLTGGRRREMKNIVPLVVAGDLDGIAAQFRSMKRLWPTVRGLRDRREKEAVMIENATYDTLPEDLVIV